VVTGFDDGPGVLISALFVFTVVGVDEPPGVTSGVLLGERVPVDVALESSVSELEYVLTTVVLARGTYVVVVVVLVTTVVVTAVSV
jgi:hypothetical protein